MGVGTKDALTAEAISGFCAQAALLLGAGIPLQDGLETLAGDGDRLCRRVHDDMLRAGTFSGALAADGRWPEYAVEMIAIGERTGRLEEVMKNLAGYYAREGRLRSAVSGAAAYPMVLGGMLALIVAVMLWKVFPVFRRVLASLGVGMTGAAGRMMNLGAAVGWTVLIAVVLALALSGIYLLLLRTGAREKVRTLPAKLIPAVRRLRRRMTAARMATALSLLLGGGFPVDEALEQAQKAAGDEEAREKIETMRRSLAGGAAFADALVESELFDGVQNRMIRVGAAAGREDEVMAGIAAECESQAEEGVERLAAVIEPTLVVLLTVVIGAVLASVMLPMAGILSNML